MDCDGVLVRELFLLSPSAMQEERLKEMEPLDRGTTTLFTTTPANDVTLEEVKIGEEQEGFGDEQEGFGDEQPTFGDEQDALGDEAVNFGDSDLRLFCD